MNRAQRRKMAQQARRRAGAGERDLPTARIIQSLADAARNNVIEIMSQGRTPERARELATSAFFLAEHLVRRLEADQELPHPIVCREGCDFCCFNQVEVTPPEALLLGHHLAQHFTDAEKTIALAQAARTQSLIAGKSQAAIAAMRPETPCPLLRDRKCSVYQVRPLMCRAMHALDRERCAAELRSGSLAGSQYYAHRHDIAISVSAGLREGCRDLGLQSGPLNLVRALRDVFAQENSAEKWLAGEEVFGG